MQFFSKEGVRILFIGSNVMAPLFCLLKMYLSLSVHLTFSFLPLRVFVYILFPFSLFVSLLFLSHSLHLFSRSKNTISSYLPSLSLSLPFLCLLFLSLSLSLSSLLSFSSLSMSLFLFPFYAYFYLSFTSFSVSFQLVHKRTKSFLG
jgi:hypothetical protein